MENTKAKPKTAKAVVLPPFSRREIIEKIHQLPDAEKIRAQNIFTRIYGTPCRL